MWACYRRKINSQDQDQDQQHRSRSQAYSLQKTSFFSDLSVSKSSGALAFIYQTAPATVLNKLSNRRLCLLEICRARCLEIKSGLDSGGGVPSTTFHPRGSCERADAMIEVV